jgi:hypothetical protein
MRDGERKGKKIKTIVVKKSQNKNNYIRKHIIT